MICGISFLQPDIIKLLTPVATPSNPFDILFSKEIPCTFPCLVKIFVIASFGTKGGAQWTRTLNWLLSADRILKVYPLALTRPAFSIAFLPTSVLNVRYHSEFLFKGPKHITSSLTMPKIPVKPSKKSSRKKGLPSYPPDNTTERLRIDSSLLPSIKAKTTRNSEAKPLTLILAKRPRSDAAISSVRGGLVNYADQMKVFATVVEGICIVADEVANLPCTPRHVFATCSRYSSNELHFNMRSSQTCNIPRCSKQGNTQ